MTDDYFLEALDDERTFTATHHNDVAGTGSINLGFENPANSGMNATFYFGQLSHEGEALFSFHDSITGPGSETAATVSNNVIGSGESATLNVYNDITFTPDTLHEEAVYTGTGVVDVFGGYKVRLLPGEYMVLELTDQSGAADELSLRVSWAETR